MNANNLIERMRSYVAYPDRRRQGREFVGAAMHIIESGLQGLDRKDAPVLFRFANYRHERRSSIITSSKSKRMS